MILQEYLPREQAEDWIVHAYFDAGLHAPLALFTGVKVRSWPPHAGMTANAYVVDNPELAGLAAQFIKRIGFTGIVDLDCASTAATAATSCWTSTRAWARSSGSSRTRPGVDVVRAQHLDLTGRRVPEGEQRAGHRYVVENIDLPALLAYRRSGYTTPHAPRRPERDGTRLARRRRPPALLHDAGPLRAARRADICYQLRRARRRGHARTTVHPTDEFPGGETK